MSLPFFLVPSLSDAVVGGTLEVTGDEARHAVVVRRVRVDERVALTDGVGTTAVCAVASTSRSSLTAAVLELTSVPAETPRLVVVQAIPKGDRGELAVEMLTEVGVDEIVPWAASRSVGVWRGDRAEKSLQKWRATAREAAKQARRAWHPRVASMATTADVVGRLEAASLPVVLHEGASGPMSDLPVLGRGEIVIVVGPEGGIADEELEAFAQVGAEPVRLGSSVLRTSTAGVAAAAALLSRSPRWR